MEEETMEIYEIGNDAERRLQEKADRNHIPLGGAMELLPLCNMNCKMCYVKMNKKEMDAEGRMLTCDEWLSIAVQARDAGVLFLLLTGGEPLLYPEFKRLYTELMNMGIILTINTNGTLIDEAWADFFAEHPCRRFNITLYGKDDATYERLCGNPNGFTQIMRAARLLKERKIPFRFSSSLTDDNADNLPELFHIAEQFDVPLRAASYMFPAMRKGIAADMQERMSPEAAARATFCTYQLQKDRDELEYAIRSTLASVYLPPKVACAHGYTCHAGQSGFWMNWKGELLPCGMMTEPKVSLREHSFREGWKSMVAKTHEIVYGADCQTCAFQNICHVCPANLMAECGRFDRRPEYICRYTRELIGQMISALPDEWKQQNKEFISLYENFEGKYL